MVITQIMKKCCVDGCELNVFGIDKNTKLGYCKYHQYLRSDTKKYIAKKTHKERVNKLKRNKYNFDPMQWGYSSEFEMFKDLWEKSDKKSVISKRKLIDLENTNIWINCFAHILNKNHFPLYRFNPENILIVHPYEHYLIDHGRVIERINYIEDYQEANFNIFYNLQAKLKEKYIKIKLGQ